MRTIIAAAALVTMLAGPAAGQDGYRCGGTFITIPTVLKDLSAEPQLYTRRKAHVVEIVRLAIIDANGTLQRAAVVRFAKGVGIDSEVRELPVRDLALYRLIVECLD